MKMEDVAGLGYIITHISWWIIFISLVVLIFIPNIAITGLVSGVALLISGLILSHID